MKEGSQQSVGRSGIIIISILLLVFCIAPTAAIGVSGAFYKGSIPAGGSDTLKMSISNGPDDKPMDVVIDVMGFGQSVDQNYLALKPADDLSQYSARTYISLDKNTLHLEPGASGAVTATIKLPQTTGAGGRYAIIYIHALPKSGEAMTMAVQVPFLIEVSGVNPTQTGSIINITTGDVVASQPIVITTQFQNTGNIHYSHTINTVTITDPKGQILYTGSTTSSPFAIVPGSTVRYVVRPNVTGLQVGTYSIKSGVSLENGQILDEKTTPFDIKNPYIPPVTDSSITISPGTAGTLTSPDGRYTISFPQGAVLGNAVVTLKPYSKDKLSSAPTGAKFGATSFEVTGLSGLLSKDATVRVTYSADDLAVAGGDTSKLKLSYFDAAQNSWVILPTQVDAGSTTLTATTNHLSVWAVMVSSSTTSGSAPGVTATKSPVPLTVILASLIIAVIAAGKSVGKKK